MLKLAISCRTPDTKHHKIKSLPLNVYDVQTDLQRRNAPSCKHKTNSLGMPRQLMAPLYRVCPLETWQYHPPNCFLSCPRIFMKTPPPLILWSARARPYRAQETNNRADIATRLRFRTGLCDLETNWKYSRKAKASKARTWQDICQVSQVQLSFSWQIQHPLQTSENLINCGPLGKKYRLIHFLSRPRLRWLQRRSRGPLTRTGCLGRLGQSWVSHVGFEENSSKTDCFKA